MSTQEQTRPLDELVLRAAALLDLDEGHIHVREDFISIARAESPNKTYDVVEAKARVKGGFTPDEAVKIARAARWLAIIRRDYGQQAFDNVVASWK